MANLSLRFGRNDVIHLSIEAMDGLVCVCVCDLHACLPKLLNVSQGSRSL